MAVTTIIHTSGYTTCGVEVSTSRVERGVYETAVGFAGVWSDPFVSSGIGAARDEHDRVVRLLANYDKWAGHPALVARLRDIGAGHHPIVLASNAMVAA